MNLSGFGRRRILLIGAGGGALWLSRSVLQSAFAVDEIENAINSNAKAANELLIEVTELPQPAIYDQAREFLDRELSLRLDISKTLSLVEPASLFNYVRPSEQEVAALIVLADTPIAPGPESVVASQAESAEVSAEPQSVADVVIDIVFDAIGLLDLKEIVKEVVQDSPELGELVQEIADQARRENWEEVADAVDKLLKFIGGGEFLYRLVKKAGQQRAKFLWGRIMQAIGVRFVPFVGWFYFGIALMVAIKKNWPALKRVIEEQPQ